jgi:hypothetical protein
MCGVDGSGVGLERSCKTLKIVYTANTEVNSAKLFSARYISIQIGSDCQSNSVAAAAT